MHSANQRAKNVHIRTDELIQSPTPKKRKRRNPAVDKNFPMPKSIRGIEFEGKYYGFTALQ